jgi:uncharacterized protein (TIGR03435 family)
MSDSPGPPSRTFQSTPPSRAATQNQRGRLRFAGRNVTIGFIGDTLSAGTRLGRPMVDQTGINGTVDFILEFSFDPGGGPPPSIDSEPPVDLQNAFRPQFVFGDVETTVSTLQAEARATQVQ